MKNKLYLAVTKLAVIAMITILAGCAGTQTSVNAPKAETGAVSWINLDTVKAGKFDTGKMWTFDFPPVDYFKSEYNFNASEEWMNKVRMSALRFATYCSASFVSGDGLVMTNHHCARESVTEANREGEDLHKNGFIAETLADERKVPGLFVDQLVLILDVTDQIQPAMDKGKTNDEKLKLRDSKKKELEAQYKKETGLETSVVTFYNGGKYSLYGYKRYNDVRLVFAPETQLGFFGGDPDNFTYPRYALDCSFFRVYDEDGKPLKTENYFKWSPNGAVAGEPVFVVGNPGTTTRLRTVSQLEYQRDIQGPATVQMLTGLVKIYSEIIKENPEREAELQDRLFGFANSEKAYKGILEGLRDPVMMQKKRDFENNFKSAVMAKPELASKYGHLWDEVAKTRAEVRKVAAENNAYNMSPIASSQYLTISRKLLELARQLNLPDSSRDAKYKADMLEQTKAVIFPEQFDEKLQYKTLILNIEMISAFLGENNPVVKNLTGGKKGREAADYALANSSCVSKDKVKKLADAGADAILSSNDPLLQYVKIASERGKEYSVMLKEITNKENDNVQLLGRALFEVYGTSIPPDATFTLRISDGIVQGYDYNGTVAPEFTTFYGLYDRWASFGKKFPWNLPDRWINRPADFDLETPMVFVSTNDIIGGNSGSPVINKNAEVVGLAFDGNIESLPGQFIFTTEYNRTVSVHSEGMIEAIQDLYKFKRLSKELDSGKLAQ